MRLGKRIIAPSANNQRPVLETDIPLLNVCFEASDYIYIQYM